ncbi:MAG TPA: hypothetical protein VJS30_23575 [Paraburkholderia sp.]|nr:hypothetical protein [Paraburkholderia sp.]
MFMVTRRYGSGSVQMAGPGRAVNVALKNGARQPRDCTKGFSRRAVPPAAEMREQISICPGYARLEVWRNPNQKCNRLHF